MNVLITVVQIVSKNGSTLCVRLLFIIGVWVDVLRSLSCSSWLWFGLIIIAIALLRKIYIAIAMKSVTPNKHHNIDARSMRLAPEVSSSPSSSLETSPSPSSAGVSVVTDGSAWPLPLPSTLGKLSTVLVLVPVMALVLCEDIVELEKTAVEDPSTTMAPEEALRVWSSITTTVELCRLSD